MIVTTTPNVDGRQVSAYLGVVAGEAIVGSSLMRDAFAGIHDIVGGRSGAMEQELGRARSIALADLEAAAAALGAHAVVAVQLTYASLGQEGLLLVSATGTAVKLY